MFKKINDFLGGWPMTLVGGLFLLASFILPRVGWPAGERLSVLGVLNPTTGALVHNAGSCFVVLLAALLYDRKYKG